jgi:hypothetical protein
MFDCTIHAKRRASWLLSQGHSEGGRQMRRLQMLGCVSARSRRDQQEIELALNLLALSAGLVAITQLP